MLSTENANHCIVIGEEIKIKTLTTPLCFALSNVLDALSSLSSLFFFLPDLHCPHSIDIDAQ